MKFLTPFSKSRYHLSQMHNILQRTLFFTGIAQACQAADKFCQNAPVRPEFLLVQVS